MPWLVAALFGFLVLHRSAQKAALPATLLAVKGMMRADVEHAVAMALAHETEPQRLRAFAGSLPLPVYAREQAQLNARAGSLHG